MHDLLEQPLAPSVPRPMADAFDEDLTEEVRRFAEAGVSRSRLG